MDIRAFRRLAAPLARRLALMASRAVVTLINDGARMQGLQIRLLADETMDGVERFQNYGFTAHPHPGAEGIALSVGGHRSHAVVIAVDDRRYRLKALAQGEVALYTDEGDTFILRRGRVIEANTETFRINAAVKVEMNTPLVETTGQIRAAGDITDQVESGGRSMSGMRTIYDIHVHPENDAGGPTDEPDQKMGTV